MRSQWKRLLMAALMSLSCAGATFLWYRMTESRIDLSGATPLAQVSSVDDEVLRRPSTRLLWLPVNTGDNLYTGETIRTSNRGELNIQLLKGGSIKLEPDSLVVLQESKGQISLDLMEGSLFVDAKKSDSEASDAPKLVLNSKSGQVDLTGASATLSKGSGGRVDLQVVEGTAKVRGANGKSQEVTSGKTSSLDEKGTIFDTSNWKILSPRAGLTLFINLEDEKPVAFEWLGLPKEWKVHILAGETKKTMKEIGTTAPGETSASVKLPLGKFWWKLIAKDPQNQTVAEKSSSSRLEILAHRVPAVTSPLANAKILMEGNAGANVLFQWEKPESGADVRFEVSAKADLSEKIFERQFQKENQFSLPGLKEGLYYWRVSVSPQGEGKAFTGPLQKFVVEKPQAKEPARLAWSLKEDQLIQTYVADPSLNLAWEAQSRQSDIKSYRVRIENQQSPTENPQVLDSPSSSLKAVVAKGGRYIASVEALDQEGQVIGRSSEQILEAKELPLLPPPNFFPETGNLQTGFDGNAELKWESIPGAKNYTLILSDKSGKELAKKSYRNASALLQNLMPGEYRVQLEVTDAWGRTNLQKDPRTLVVPDRSNLKAPSLKKIKVN